MPVQVHPQMSKDKWTQVFTENYSPSDSYKPSVYWIEIQVVIQRE